MVESIAVAGTDDGDGVGVLGDVGEEGGDFGAGLAVALEGPRGAAHDRFGEIDPAGFEAFDEGGGDGLAAAFGELGLGVPGVDVADAAVHEQINDRFNFGGEVGRLGSGVEE